MTTSTTSLHQLPSGLWACYSRSLGRNSVMLGYCLAPEQESIVGPTWEEAMQDTALARCLPSWGDREAWELDRALRITNEHKFHRSGHFTEDEALGCYAAFLVDFDREEL